MNATVPNVNEAGHTLYLWEQDGVQWACCAYDHGPMCRRCQKVEGTMASLIDNVLDGNMWIMDDPKGDFKFQVTPKGKAYAKELADNDPEAKRIMETSMLEATWEKS